MLYKYIETFHLRNETGTCPSMEVEIDVTGKSQFFITSYHITEEDKKILDKVMKRLCHLGKLKEGF